jgi:hypothetical protein
VGMKWIRDDGGRAAAGFRGDAGDCVCRSIAIVAERPYAEVYKRLADSTGDQRAGKRGRKARSAANGISTSRKWFRDYMAELGLRFVPLMQIGSGCTAHLRDGEPWVPHGRVIVAVSKHYTALIDGVIHDTHDPSRGGSRCVYGYWALQDTATHNAPIREHRSRKAVAWRPGLDIRRASVPELVAEVVRITGTIVPRLPIESAAAMLAEIDAAILSAPPFADAHRDAVIPAELLAGRMRQLEMWLA